MSPYNSEVLDQNTLAVIPKTVKPPRVHKILATGGKRKNHRRALAMREARTTIVPLLAEETLTPKSTSLERCYPL